MGADQYANLHIIRTGEIIGTEQPKLERASLAAITWTRGTENGREVWTCDRCSREHLRSIEGNLDSAWW